MSEPIKTEGAGKNSSPYPIELPPNPVGFRMVPNFVASEPTAQNDGEVRAALVKTGKLEIRFDGSSLPTKNDAKKTVDWMKVAYNVAHQTAYYKQVHDNLTARAEEYERKYTTALRDYQTVVIQRDEGKRDADRLRPLISSALFLKNWWGFFLLPKSFRKLIGTA